jgi:hypothetical protein
MITLSRTFFKPQLRNNYFFNHWSKIYIGCVRTREDKNKKHAFEGMLLVYVINLVLNNPLLCNVDTLTNDS